MLAGSVDTAAVSVLAGPGRMAELHAAEMPQKDNLCGAFWGSLALRAAGIEQLDGEPVDQDTVAREAGAILPSGGDPASWLPPGGTSRDDYRLQLPTSDDESITGTSAIGVAAAVEKLAGGALTALPVTGGFTAENVLGLLAAVAEEAPDAALVANIQTGPLWNSRPPMAVVLSALAGRPVAPPAAEWDVGHFVSIAGVLHGDGGSLVIVRDTYPSIGVQGHHLQPPDRVARALVRSDGREGGVLVIDAPQAAARVRARCLELGLEIRLWDNGTPISAGEE